MMALSFAMQVVSHSNGHGFMAIPDTPEAEEIINSLNRYYAVMHLAYATGNSDVLAEVLVDHPDYRAAIDPEHWSKVQAYVSEILGPASAQDFGYLTVMKNKLIHRLQGRELLQAALAVAKTENRDLTDSEIERLKTQNHGVMPSLPEDNASSQDQIVLRKEHFRSIEIDSDKARAVYERVTIRTAILVRIDGKWYVAGIF